MVRISLKGDVVKAFDQGTTVAQIAAALGAGLAKAACAAKIDGKVCDLRTPVEADCAVEILTFDDSDGKKAFWHTASHVLAQAVQRLFPERLRLRWLKSSRKITRLKSSSLTSLTRLRR